MDLSAWNSVINVLAGLGVIVLVILAYSLLEAVFMIVFGLVKEVVVLVGKLLLHVVSTPFRRTKDPSYKRWPYDDSHRTR